MVTPAGCARHQARVYARGGVTLQLDLTPLISVRWNRKRDDISDAFVTVGVQDCCEELGELETIVSELHIFRVIVIPVLKPIVVTLAVFTDRKSVV